MKSTHLHDNWTLLQIERDCGFHRPQLKPAVPIPARVPGSVHLDLVEAGMIANPFERRFEVGAQWVDEAGWSYRRSLPWSGSAYARQVLRFECLDTIAEVRLNGEVIARSDNFFLPVEIDLTDRLVTGENEIEVRFSSPVLTGESRRLDWFRKHGLPEDFVMFDERAFVRKPGYMSGWDWGPRLVGMGIAGPVSLIEFDARITDVELVMSPVADGWFEVTATSICDGQTDISCELIPGNPETEVREIACGKWQVRGPLWWPRGMGDQPLHTIRATAGAHVVEKRFGLRTIELVREVDSYGEGFEFRVNGRPVWSRGANWIPNDSFPCRITAQDYRDQIEAFAKLNFNMMRVWGGGLYESEAFYDACDELGILVWQDFPYACMFYPDDEEWQERARVEAEHQIRRLRHRASLAIWCGNNENLVMWHQKWGSPNRVPDRYYGENIYDKALPEAVNRLDPQRPYIASSPIGMHPDESIPIGADRHAGMDGYGDSHYWDVWHGRGDWKFYSESKARFSSEFGFAASCSLALWRNTLAPTEQGSFPNDAVLYHDKTGKPWPTFLGYVTTHYPEPKSLEDWVYYSQLNQRDAFRYGIEFYRRSPFCRGSLIWQANDCWPVTSWAVQDYARLMKPSGFELARVYGDVVLCIEHVADAPNLIVHIANESGEVLSGAVLLELFDTVEGRKIGEYRADATVQPDSRIVALDIDLTPYPMRRMAARVTLPPSRPGWRPHRPQVSAEGSLHTPSDQFVADERWILLAEPKATEFSPCQGKVTIIDGVLEIETEGFVGDFVVWDDDDAYAVRDEETGLPGLRAQSGIDRTFRYRYSGKGNLRARCLAGEVDLK